MAVVRTLTKRVVKIGNSYYVSLPKSWVEKHNIYEKDTILMIEDDAIVLMPLKKFVVNVSIPEFEGDADE